MIPPDRRFPFPIRIDIPDLRAPSQVDLGVFLRDGGEEEAGGIGRALEDQLPVPRQEGHHPVQEHEIRRVEGPPGVKTRSPATDEGGGQGMEHHVLVGDEQVAIAPGGHVLTAGELPLRHLVHPSFHGLDPSRPGEIHGIDIGHVVRIAAVIEIGGLVERTHAALGNNGGNIRVHRPAVGGPVLYHLGRESLAHVHPFFEVLRPDEFIGELEVGRQIVPLLEDFMQPREIPELRQLARRAGLEVEDGGVGRFQPARGLARGVLFLKPGRPFPDAVVKFVFVHVVVAAATLVDEIESTFLHRLVELDRFQRLDGIEPGLAHVVRQFVPLPHAVPRTVVQPELEVLRRQSRRHQGLVNPETGRVRETGRPLVLQAHLDGGHRVGNLQVVVEPVPQPLVGTTPLPVEGPDLHLPRVERPGDSLVRQSLVRDVLDGQPLLVRIRDPDKRGHQRGPGEPIPGVVPRRVVDRGHVDVDEVRLPLDGGGDPALVQTGVSEIDPRRIEAFAVRIHRVDAVRNRNNRAGGQQGHGHAHGRKRPRTERNVTEKEGRGSLPEDRHRSRERIGARPLSARRGPHGDDVRPVPRRGRGVDQEG